jgi:hypothetical protein
VGRTRQSLSPTACELLHAIWRLEKELIPQGKGVTKIELATSLGVDESYIPKMVHEIQRISDEYIIKRSYTPPENKGLPGRPLTSYHLNHDKIVTWPETSLILLELLKYMPERVGRISREEFVNHLKQKLGLDESFTQDRIDWGIECRYVEVSRDGKYIHSGDRTFGEKDYLEFLRNAFLSSRSN